MMSTQLSTIAGLLYLLAMVLYIANVFSTSRIVGRLATAGAAVGVFLQVAAFFLRWTEFSRLAQLSAIRSIPLTNLYESVLFFVLCIMTIYLYAERKMGTRIPGALVSAVAGCIVLFLDVSGARPEIQPLVPALQSNWLLAHVSLSFVAYASFAISFATGILYLMVTATRKTSAGYLMWTGAVALMVALFLGMGLDALLLDGGMGRSTFLKASLRSGSSVAQFVSVAAPCGVFFLVWHFGGKLASVAVARGMDADILDEVTYKCIAAGFLVFTLGGLVFGAVWANQAWGRYWSWDPKETWALVTWLIYAGYLHTRNMGGWRGERSNVIAVLGFLCTIFTYFGVNLLLSGLHTYGGLN